MQPSSTQIGLEEAASIVGVHRATINEMVRTGRIPAERIGPHWYIERQIVEEFSRTYQRPRNAPKRMPTNATRERWTYELLQLLNSWHSARVDELADFIDLHPGNIRKYLNQAERDGLLSRDTFAVWSLTPEGRQWLGDRKPISGSGHLRSIAG
jgi:excisionase family DNA binding protein